MDTFLVTTAEGRCFLGHTPLANLPSIWHTRPSQGLNVKGGSGNEANKHLSIDRICQIFHCRYFSNSTRPTEFAVDDSNATAWQSHGGETPVAFVVRLNATTVLSKIIVKTSPSYQKAVLQFSASGDSEWQDLQYHAVNCMTSFGVEANLG